MVLGFKEMFWQYVWEGSKTHTIRGEGREWKPGDTCHCDGNVRQKGQFRIGTWTCTKVERIRFVPVGIATASSAYTTVRVFIEDVELTDSEKNELAYRDGFRGSGRNRDLSFALMIDFWLDQGRLKDGKPWHGQLIHWRYDAATRAKSLPLRKSAA